jgi:putative glycosyltransferase (TIGR04372 family)
MNTDVAYSAHSPNTLFFFAYDKNISNNYVFDLIKKKKRIYFSNFFIFIINLLKNNLDPRIYREYVLDWDQIQPRFNKFYTTRPFISFLEKDINNFKSFLDTNNINKNFICFNNRDNIYLKKKNITDPNNHDYRNFKFEDFSLAIDQISKKYSVIRIGQFQDNEDKIKVKNFFDFTNSKYNEKDLVFFNYLSRYNVLSLTGLTGLQQCFRKKGLYVNFIPFNLNLLTYTSPGSIIIPKKIFSNKLNRNLNFFEMNELNINVHNANDFFLKNELKIINNLPQDILSGAEEMEDELDCADNNDFKKIQDDYWKIFGKKNIEKVKYLRDQLNIKISGNFLLKNTDLLI